MNSIIFLDIRKESGVWIFDDEAHGLTREPFVCGAGEIIDSITRTKEASAEPVRVFFSAQKFPGSKFQLEWLKSEGGGNWYRLKNSDLEGWLCPALFHYFETTPKEIHIKIGN